MQSQRGYQSKTLKPEDIEALNRRGKKRRRHRRTQSNINFDLGKITGKKQASK